MFMIGLCLYPRVILFSFSRGLFVGFTRGISLTRFSPAGIRKLFILMGSSLAKFPKSRKLVSVAPPKETAKHPSFLPSLLLGTGHCQLSVLSPYFYNTPFLHPLAIPHSSLLAVCAAPRARAVSGEVNREYTIFNSVLLSKY